jgi:iron complex outermembrane recepter protein
MNTKLRLAILASLGVAGPMLWQECRAAEAAQPADSNALTTIVVTAEKREEKLQDVPMSITALGGRTLDKLQDRDFSDYAAMVPGLSLVSGQPGFTRLTLRGQNAGGVGSTVAVYIDESPFGSSTALLNGSINTGDFDTWDLQRVEVLRGPQGTLYGANSEGGLLKFVTNAPELGTFSGAAEVTGESVDHGGQGGDVRAVLNLPIGDKVAFRISGFDQDVPGYIDDPSRGKTDVNDGHKEGGRASLLAAPTDDLSIRLTAQSQQAKYNATSAVDVDPVTLRPLHGDLTQERPISEPSSFKYENYNATIDWNAGPFSILSTTSYGILKADTFNDVTPMYGVFSQLIFDGTPGAALDNNTELKKFTQEIRLRSKASDRLEWQVGGYFTRETAALEQGLDAVNFQPTTFVGLLEQPVINSTYKESAGFVDLTYHFNSQFDIQAGGRYSKNQQTAVQTVTFAPELATLSGVTSNPQIEAANSSGHVFTYSVAPRWHVDVNTMVYARLSTGYRPGGPNVLPPVVPPNVERQYGPDKTTNVELGVKSTQLQGLLTIDVAAFHVDWKNIQLFEVVNSFGINGNGGTARSQGVEWTFGYVPVQGLTFQWVGAFTDAKLTSPAPDLNGLPGDPLPYAPKWGTSLDGEYDRSLFSNWNGFVGATWSYVGTRSTDFGSSAATPPTQVGLPSYNTLAARLGVANDRYRVTLYGKNLTDSRGITNYEGVQSAYQSVSYIQPRTIGVTLDAKF